MQDLKVVLVQANQFWEDKKKNLEHFEQLLSKNITEKVDLVLLPEMFNTSFSMNVEQLAETIEGNGVKWLTRQADKFNCQVGATLIIQENDNYFNRFVIVSSQGLEKSYDKRHLFRMANENDSFTAGTKRAVYQLKGWNILLQVCYDLRFPVFSRNKVINGEKEYDLVIYLANWPAKRSEIWQTLLTARAIENQVYCIGVNRVGNDGNDIRYSGNSMMIDPWGHIEYNASPNSEHVKIVTLKRETLDDITARFPAYLDAD